MSRLAFRGPATVRTVEAFRSTLIEALDRHAALEIDCVEIGDVDASFIQLLLSARKSACHRGKALSLAQPASGVLREALTRGGFLAPAQRTANDDADFWLKRVVAS